MEISTGVMPSKDWAQSLYSVIREYPSSIGTPWLYRKEMGRDPLVERENFMRSMMASTAGIPQSVK